MKRSTLVPTSNYLDNAPETLTQFRSQVLTLAHLVMMDINDVPKTEDIDKISKLADVAIKLTMANLREYQEKTNMKLVK